MACLGGKAVDVDGVFCDLSGKTRFLSNVTLSTSSLLSSESDEEVISRDLGAAVAGGGFPGVRCRLLLDSSLVDEELESESDDVIRWRDDDLLLDVRTTESEEFLRLCSVTTRDNSSSLEQVARDLLALLRRRLLACINNIPIT